MYSKSWRFSVRETFLRTGSKSIRSCKLFKLNDHFYGNFNQNTSRSISLKSFSSESSKSPEFTTSKISSTKAINNSGQFAYKSKFEKSSNQLSSSCSSNSSNTQSSFDEYLSRHKKSIKFIIIGSTLAFVIYELRKNVLFLKQVHAQEISQDELANQYGKFNKRLPTISVEELSKHNCKANGIWVAFREGVYDITSFVDQHPGGSIIKMGAGNRIDSFWSIYANHKTKQVLELLETFRIANIALDKDETTKTESDIYDPFSNDPIRNPLLKVHTKKPFNAETPGQLIGKDFLTPNEAFFVRNHLPVPEIDPNEYRLEIGGHGLDKNYEFTLEDLKKFPKHDIIVTIQCAGNRRQEFNKYGEVKGLPWQKGAISTAKWSGVYLVDLLNSINCDLNNKNIKHVICEGYDYDPSSTPYSASVQSELALDPNNRVMIAYAMNDQDIPRDHGFPVRFIVPGVVGARNVKWLSKISLSNEEANSHWQRSDYKSFTPDINMSNVDFSKGYSIQKLPVQSAICDPDHGSKISIKQIKENQGKIKVSGYAFSSADKIIRVDVSKNNLSVDQKGLIWNCARLFGENEFAKKVELDQKLKSGLITAEEFNKECEQLPTNLMKQDTFKSYSWILWSIEMKIDEQELKSGNKIEFICKATDSSYNTQPENCKHLYNFRGVLNNSWHRIEIELV